MGKLYIISGDDDFSRKQRAREIIGTIAGDNPEDNPALEIISADSPDQKLPVIAGRFLDSLRTPPFLCGEKIIWLRHFPDLEPFNSAERENPFDEIAEFLSEPLPDEITVVIDGPGLDQRKSFAKAMKSAGAVLESRATAKMTDRNYADTRRMIIEDFMKSSGKQISNDAIQFLCDTVGGDTGILGNELEKLRCYVGINPSITLADCQNIVSKTPETISWEYTGAIVSGNAPRALQLLGILMAGKDAENWMINILSGEFQKMIQTKLAMQELRIQSLHSNVFSALPPDIKEKFPNNPLLKLHPYRAFKICESASRFSDAALKHKITLIRDAARALVSGGGDRRIILEQLTLKLTRKDF